MYRKAADQGYVIAELAVAVIYDEGRGVPQNYRDGKITEHRYIEHYPPDTTAALFWLKNRRPDRWRDVQRVDAALGHYVIADRPLTESEWARERAIADKTIDVTPGVTPKELDGK